MKTAGIIGGIGPESTIVYYRSLIAAYRERRPDGSYPSIIVDSIDVTRMLDLVAAEKLAGLTAYLLHELERLARAGADFALMAANTPHIVFDVLDRRSPIPLLSIVETARRAAASLGLTRLGLFGTRFTMQGRFYADPFLRSGMALVPPGPEEQAYIHDRYMGELLNGVVLPETRQGLLAIVRRLKADEAIEGVILAGTELSLILQDAEYEGIPFLDTTRLHVERAAEMLLS